MSAALGIDMGGTATRWVLVDENDTEIARGQAPGANGHLYRPDALDAFKAAAWRIAADLPKPPELGVHAGVTGHDPKVADQSQRLLAEALGIAPSLIVPADDVDLAYLAAFEPGQGHLVLAGTGSVALHIAQDGTVHRAGGRGILVDDGGSGAWIGLAALRAVWRRIDATGRPSDAGALAEALAEMIGAADWDSTRAYVYGRDRGAVADLSRAVARVAQAGDPLAQAILTDAGHEIARLCRAMLDRCGAAPVGLVGGVLNLHPLILDTVRADLPGVDITFPKIDAARHAARIALNRLKGNTTT